MPPAGCAMLRLPPLRNPHSGGMDSGTCSDLHPGSLLKHGHAGSVLAWFVPTTNAVHLLWDPPIWSACMDSGLATGDRTADGGSGSGWGGMEYGSAHQGAGGKGLARMLTAHRTGGVSPLSLELQKPPM